MFAVRRRLVGLGLTVNAAGLRSYIVPLSLAAGCFCRVFLNRFLLFPVPVRLGLRAQHEG